MELRKQPWFWRSQRGREGVCPMCLGDIAEETGLKQEMVRPPGSQMCIRYAYMEVDWAGVSQKDIYFFKRRLEDHPISQGGYKILGESNREKGLATGVAGEGWGSECVQAGFSWAGEWCKHKQAMRLQLGRKGLGVGRKGKRGSYPSCWLKRWWPTPCGPSLVR